MLPIVVFIFALSLSLSSSLQNYIITVVYKLIVCIDDNR